MTSSMSKLIVFAATVLFGFNVSAQAYPSKPISLIIPYGAGGGTDMFGRAFAEELGSRLKQPVVVENIPGAGGTIAVRKVANSAPDGYTLVIANGIEFDMLRLSNTDVRETGNNELEPVVLLATQPMVLVARGGLGFKNADEFVEAAKKEPGMLSMASSGPGTSLFLTGELIKQSAGIETIDVSYRVAPQITTDLIGANVDTAVMALPSVMPHLSSGKIVALGISEATRSSLAPDIPSVNESKSISDIDTKIWYAVFGPQGMPEDVRHTVEEASLEILKDSRFRKVLNTMQMEPAKDGSAQELKSLMETHLDKFRQAAQHKPAQ